MPDIVHTPPLSVNDPAVEAVDSMIGEVASLIGGSQDPQARAKALTCLDRAADRMNMAGIYLFRRKEVEYQTAALGGSGDLLLTTGDTTLTKPADWGFPSEPIILYNAGQEIVKRAEWKAWDLFRGLIRDIDTNGIPSFFSMRSELEDEIFIWPYVDTDDVSQIRISYVARIQRPSETSSIVLQPETREALITGGSYFITQYRYLKYPNIWRPMEDEFRKAIAGALSAAKRQLDAEQWTIAPDLDGQIPPTESFGTLNPAPVFIKV